MVSEECPSGGRRESNQGREWQEKAPSSQLQEKDSEARDKEKTVQNEGLEDFERTPSGRVRRRSAQVAVFHLQEIAEDELAKDWGTKRRIKDDLVPDSKRVRGEQTDCQQQPHSDGPPGNKVPLLSFVVELHPSWSPQLQHGAAGDLEEPGEGEGLHLLHQ